MTNWAIREICERLVLPGKLANQAICELQKRYGGIAGKIANEIDYDSLGGEPSDFIAWVWVWMYSTRRLNTFALKMLEVAKEVGEKEHRSIAGGYLKKVILSGKIEFIKEFSLFDALDEEAVKKSDTSLQEDSYEEDFFPNNNVNELFINELNNLKQRDRIVIALAFFSSTQKLQLNDFDMVYLNKLSGLTSKELNERIDEEVIRNSKKEKFPISAKFISQLLYLSLGNVYKIKQRFKERLQAVVEGK